MRETVRFQFGRTEPSRYFLLTKNGVKICPDADRRVGIRVIPTGCKKASCKIRPYTSRSNVVPGRSSYPLLKAGALTAHEVYRLMLLGSPPDMVHSSQLRETHSSTQQNTVQTVKARPSDEGSTPAVADFRCRAPLIPRLVWPYFAACAAQADHVGLLVLV